MNNLHKVFIFVCFAVAVALGAWQGVRVRHLREAERFYRWILAQSTQTRLFAGDTDQSDQQKLDFALYYEIVEAADPAIPDLPIGEDDYDTDGKPMRKMTIAARDEQYSGLVFKLASGDVLAKQREEFLKYSQERRISSVASEFDPAAAYNEGVNVSLANIFFGFRKVAANFMWLQVDKYWHQGMEQRMIPLMKMCTWLDPTFVDAFQLGAWHLAYNMTAKLPDTPEPLKKWNEKYKARIGEKELYYYIAIDFLKDGIRKNPRNHKLYFDLGYSIYNLKMKDYDNAVKYLTEAVRYPHEIWVPRMLNISLEEAGRYEQALAGWETFLKRNPGHPTAIAFIERNKGRIKEQKGFEAAQRALTETDPAAAAADKAQAETLRQEAIAIYEKMSQPTEDPFAVGRIMKIKADRFMEEGLYPEAAAVLQNARWKSNQLWDEATDLMIQAKIKGNIPLELGEKKYVLRKEEAEKYKQAAKKPQQPAPAQ
jgi:hypothetical protein